jgi:hypothetical protein
VRTAVVLTLATTLAGVALMSTDVGRLALLDQWERTSLALGRRIDDAQYETLRNWSQRAAPAYAAGLAVARGPVLSLAIAIGLVMVVGTGGQRPIGEAPRPSFRAVLSVVVHASTVLALRDVLAAGTSYVRESMTSLGSLGLWFPAFDAGSPAGRLLGAIDLLIVWWLVVLAIGAAALYRRPARPLALAFVGLYLGIALALVAVTAALDVA